MWRNLWFLGQESHVPAPNVYRENGSRQHPSQAVWCFLCGAPALFLHSSWTALSVRNKNVALLVMATTIALLLACRLLFWGFSSHYYEQQRQPARKTRKNPQRESSVDLREKQRFLQEKEKGKKKGFLFSTWSACVRNLPCNRAYHRVWKWAQKVSLSHKNQILV